MHFAKFLRTPYRTPPVAAFEWLLKLVYSISQTSPLTAFSLLMPETYISLRKTYPEMKIQEILDVIVQ